MGLMKSLRDNTKYVMLLVILSFVALMIFEWGMDVGGMGGGSNVVGEVNGEQILYEEIHGEYTQLLELERQQRGEVERGHGGLLGSRRTIAARERSTSRVRVAPAARSRTVVGRPGRRVESTFPRRDGVLAARHE